MHLQSKFGTIISTQTIFQNTWIFVFFKNDTTLSEVTELKLDHLLTRSLNVNILPKRLQILVYRHKAKGAFYRKP